MSRELLFSVTRADFEIETFRVGGHGGQKVNKTNSGVRIRHRPSGAVSECRETRSQAENKKIAFMRLIKTPEFEVWRKKKASELMLSKQDKERQEARIRQNVDRMMSPENLLVEVKSEDDIWIPETWLDT